ncbi:hypothetical protein LUW76_05615 [Actinomadura madurae]|uniref:hypothetical protein n=1 Tax=Actinomadura madurae TaxID=1993 RepID=UPI002026C0DA|nr:hypothetical protein [Actinomadura madurae]URM93840.1 hypothetical protein LUW76_05615 [Actinomadura madurae]URN04563.1 hypothetical protein LUW74_15400 [Actinomadura madurae]
MQLQAAEQEVSRLQFTRQTLLEITGPSQDQPEARRAVAPNLLPGHSRRIHAH